MESFNDYDGYMDKYDQMDSDWEDLEDEYSQLYDKEDAFDSPIASRNTYDEKGRNAMNAMIEIMILLYLYISSPQTFKNLRMDIKLPKIPTNRPVTTQISTIGSSTVWNGTISRKSSEPAFSTAVRIAS